MPISTRDKTCFFLQLKNIFFISLLLSSCIVPKHYQKDKPFITSYSIEVKGGKFTKDETSVLKSRLSDQLDDSAKVTVVDKYFIRHVYNNPPAFDTAYAGQSARNMQASMLHIGYYKATAKFTADTVIKSGQKRVTVQYIVEPGKPTLIDTVGYRLRNADLTTLTQKNMEGSLLEQGKPVTKSGVLGEISRLVQLYRNNGYYKFTAEELKVRGDTTLEALTNISDDPFEQLQLLAEAQQKKDSPEIKLAVVLNEPKDSGRLKKYFINNVYILPDYRPGDRLTGDSSITERVTRTGKYIIRYHNKLFRTGFLIRNVTLKKGDLYNQENYYRMLNNFSRAGVWQSVNIDVNEVKDSINKIDLIIQLIPAKQFSFESGVEASFSATSNTNSVTAANSGNLLGLSGNVALTNRNLGKEGIKMTTALRAGVELNLSSDNSGKKNVINSNELSLSNSIVFPRFIFPFAGFNNDKRITSPETFINTNVSLINRINLFNLQSFNLGIGYTWRNRKKELGGYQKEQFLFKPLNIEFTRLYNETDSFIKTLESNPFLRYSFNTALVAGSSIGYSLASTNKKHTNRQYSFKANIEESGFPFVPMFIPLRKLNILNTYLRQYLKTDVEYIHTRTKPKSAFVFRLFAGVGISSKQDTTLPFFKQYFGGGSNSMRGWPIRGIGRGSQPLAAYGTNRFNDRTGDIQLEGNIELRHHLLQIIPNSVILKGAFFVDAGNIWNLRNSKPGGGTDSAQFNFKNLWKEFGINAGYGFRIDFNYFLIRFDFGFRIKRPELSYVNDGWKIPAIGFDDVIKKIFGKGKVVNGVNNEEYRRWRYENFNFTIGINYPF